MAHTTSEFLFMQAEVDFLGQLHHPNLVKLVGYCIEDDQRLLVYEFMTRGSLENHLFRSKSLYTLKFSIQSSHYSFKSILLFHINHIYVSCYTSSQDI